MAPHHILIGEDDLDDRMLIESAFQENGFDDQLVFLGDGVSIIEYLQSPIIGKDYPIPKFILLDLNMPKKNGLETLVDIKKHPTLHRIPVVILSTTNNEKEMNSCYEHGANSYITKPRSFEALVKTIEAVRSYWINTSKIPNPIS